MNKLLTIIAVLLVSGCEMKEFEYRERAVCTKSEKVGVKRCRNQTGSGMMIGGTHGRYDERQDVVEHWCANGSSRRLFKR